MEHSEMTMPTSEFQGMIRAPSGMEIAVLPFAEKSRIYMWLCVKTGSLDGFIPIRGPAKDTDITCRAISRGKSTTLVYRPGIDHAVEHMIFKGTTDPQFRTPFAINNFYAPRNRDDIDAHGADTQELAVRYYVETEPDGLEESLRFLGALTLRSLLNSRDPRMWKHLLREWEKERRVILEEKSFYNDDAEITSLEETLRMMFPLHPLRHSVDGSREDIFLTKRWEVAARYHARYHPSNFLLIVIGGGVTGQVIKKLAAKHFKPKRRKALYIPIPEATLSEDVPLKERVKFIPAAREKIYFSLGFPFERPTTPRDENLASWIRRHHSVAVLQKFFGGRWASKPFTELREKRGIGYRHNAFCYEFPGAGTLLYSTHTFPDNIERALHILLRIYRKFAIELVDETEFQNAQKSLIDELEAARETPGDLAVYIFFWQRLAGRVPMFEDMKKEVLAVTREDVLAAAREIITPARLYATFVGNIPSESFQKRVVKIFRNWQIKR